MKLEIYTGYKIETQTFDKKVFVNPNIIITDFTGEINGFIPAEHDLNEFQNLGADPFAHVSDIPTELGQLGNNGIDPYAHLSEILRNHSELNLDDGKNPHGADLNDLTNIGLNDLQFDTTPDTTLPLAEGQFRWNATDSTLDLGMLGGTLFQQIGQELFIKVINKTLSTITAGTAVYFTGRLGYRPLIAPARSDTDATAKVMGITTKDIPANTEGLITVFGYVRQIKTDYPTWAVNQDLYVSKTVAGQLTNVEPESPHSADIVGNIAVIGGVGIGAIFVRIDRHRSLSELADINGTPLTTTGQILVWDESLKSFDFTENITEYAKLTDIPTPTPPFVPADHDLSEFDNLSVDPYAHVSELPTPTPPFIPADHDLSEFDNLSVDPFAHVSELPTPTPPFIPADHDLSEFDNLSADPYAHVSELPTPTPPFIPADHDLSEFDNLSVDPFAHVSELPVIPPIPTKANATDIATGTDDEKFATSKALADAGVKRFHVGPTAPTDTTLIWINTSI